MPIERDDLEAKLREIEDVVDETKQAAQNTAVIAAIVVVVVIALAFFFGRRTGRVEGGARVEVYRLP